MQHIIHFILTTIILVAISISDSKHKKIPNRYIIMISVLALINSVSEIIISGRSPLYIMAGAVAGGVVLVPAYLITGKNFGAGDIKLFAVLGISMGLKGIIFCVLFTMTGAALYIFTHKKSARGESVAMAPFVLYSYIIISCPGI